jgi:hypothetical protein
MMDCAGSISKVRRGPGGLGQTYLHEVWVMATSLEGASNDRDKVLRAPRGLLTSLDDNSITGKGGADDRTQQVVERVIPGNAGSDHTKRFISELHFLVALQRPRYLAFLRDKRLLAMRKNPFDFLDCNQDLAKCRVDLGFS